MLVFLKIIHIGALMAGAAAGIGNRVFLNMMIRNPGPPPDMVARFMAIMGRTSLIAMVLLWLSGLWMAFGIYHIGLLSWIFWLKFAAATVALLGVVLLGRTVAAAQKAGTPPPLDRLKGLSNMTTSGVVLAVILAVVEFN